MAKDSSSAQKSDKPAPRFLSRAAERLINVSILAALVLAVYGRSLKYDFVWDDSALVVPTGASSQTQWFWAFFQSFWKRDLDIDDPSRAFYRPLVSLSFRLDALLWGNNPFGFHLTNLALHMLCVLLAYSLALRLLEKRWSALLAGIIFAIHPTHAENVCWISGRTDIISAVFYLPAFIFFLEWLASDGAIRLGLMTVVAYGLSLFAKETALSFPVLAIACSAHPAIRRRKFGEILALFSCLFVATIIYLLLRVAALGAVIGRPIYGTTLTRLLTLPVVLLKYAGLLVGVVGTDPHHPDQLVGTLLSPLGITSLLFVVLLAIAFVTLWKRGETPPLVGLLLTVAPILPALNLGIFGDVLYADRFLYIPSAGFGIIAGWFCTAVYRRLSSASTVLKSASFVLLGMWLVAILVAASTNAIYWKNDLTLFARSVRTSGASAYVRYNYGNALLKAGRIEEAIAQFTEAARLDPRATFPLTNAGIALGTAGRWREAMEFFKKAETCGENSTVLYDNMGNAQRHLGMLHEAAASYTKSLAIRKTDVAFNNLGECLIAIGRIEDARKCFLSALSLRPSAAVYNNLALVEIEVRNFAKAERWLEKAFASEKTFHPDQMFTLEYNMSRALAGQDKVKQAAIHARRALQIAADGYGPPPDSEPIRELTAVIFASSEKNAGMGTSPAK